MALQEAQRAFKIDIVRKRECMLEETKKIEEIRRVEEQIAQLEAVRDSYNEVDPFHTVVAYTHSISQLRKFKAALEAMLETPNALSIGLKGTGIR